LLDLVGRRLLSGKTKEEAKRRLSLLQHLKDEAKRTLEEIAAQLLEIVARGNLKTVSRLFYWYYRFTGLRPESDT
jgi:hypothetical protein